MLDGAGRNPEGTGHLGDFPRRIFGVLTHIAEQQGTRVDEFRGIGFGTARQGGQRLALGFCQGNAVTGCHAPV